MPQGPYLNPGQFSLMLERNSPLATLMFGTIELSWIGITCVRLRIKTSPEFTPPFIPGIRSQLYVD
jgi:hypothetical protein